MSFGVNTALVHTSIKVYDLFLLLLLISIYISQYLEGNIIYTVGLVYCKYDNALYVMLYLNLFTAHLNLKYILFHSSINNLVANL